MAHLRKAYHPRLSHVGLPRRQYKLSSRWSFSGPLLVLGRDAGVFSRFSPTHRMAPWLHEHILWRLVQYILYIGELSMHTRIKYYCNWKQRNDRGENVVLKYGKEPTTSCPSVTASEYMLHGPRRSTKTHAWGKWRTGSADRSPASSSCLPTYSHVLFVGCDQGNFSIMIHDLPLSTYRKKISFYRPGPPRPPQFGCRAKRFRSFCVPGL